MNTTYQNTTSCSGINLILPLKSVQLYQYLIGKPGEQLMASNARLSLLLNMTATDPLYEQIANWYDELMIDVLCQIDTVSELAAQASPISNPNISEVIPPQQKYSFFYTAQPIKQLADIICQLDDILFQIEAYYLTQNIDRDVFIEVVNKGKALLTDVKVRMFAMTNIGKRVEGEGAFEAKVFLRRIREINEADTGEESTEKAVEEPSDTIPPLEIPSYFKLK